MLELPLNKSFKKKAGRTHFTQCAPVQTRAGWAIEAQNHQGSFMLRAAATSALVGIFPAESSTLEEGQHVLAFVRPHGLRGMKLKPFEDD
jgi:molybdopterin biosynthesis enzyme